jgi:hypothetical protein
MPWSGSMDAGNATIVEQSAAPLRAFAFRTALKN